MEPPQDGIDFLFSVVRIEGKRVDDEVQDDEQFVPLRGNLLEGTVGVEEILQDLAGVFRFLLRFKGGTLALELPARS